MHLGDIHPRHISPRDIHLGDYISAIHLGVYISAIYIGEFGPRSYCTYRHNRRTERLSPFDPGRGRRRPRQSETQYKPCRASSPRDRRSLYV